MFFFFNDTATTEIYTLSLHDALPISLSWRKRMPIQDVRASVPLGAPHTISPGTERSWMSPDAGAGSGGDRKSTRLNSSHSQISYAVFCLKKKNNQLRDLLLHHAFQTS